MEKSRIRVGGSMIEYRWIGPTPSSAPTLVMLHEGLGCIDMWKDFPDQLARRLPMGVMVYSRAGYGGSDAIELPRKADFMHVEALEVLPELLRQLELQSFTLLGHSDGASISLIAAGAGLFQGLQSVVILAPHVFNESICVQSIRKARQAYDEGDLRSRLLSYHGGNVDVAFCGWNDVWLSDEFWRWNIERYLPKINVPVLLIQGESDKYGTSAQIDAIRTQIPAPVRCHLLTNCGHSPHRDQKQMTLQLIAKFLQGITQND